MQRLANPGVAPLVVPQRPLYRIAKRLLDIAVAATVLVIAAPVFAVCAVAVRRSSPGPIIFRQERVGLRGRTFTFLKFRSMYHHADAAPHRAYVTAFIRGEAAQHADGDKRVYKLVGDARITPAGRWLRRTSLDELPQFWSVLRGDLSLVGPRPPIPSEVEQYRPDQLMRLAVKPGITGAWQIGGRSSTTFDEMVALDLAYIRNQSFWFDVAILLKTIPAVLAARGAR
jgi:lipopolysaccharide/colanic/teichoic acid biosynthesis glycosyltransferase